ncbi:MAG: HEAT repeat domain-containing protein [Anaerolineae bacterium]|nr:HEAT repeat domain-containing protein [Anaerolineae bacterium]
MGAIALGRGPTLGEVLDYYLQDRFLSFVLDMLSVHRIVMVISRKAHWEPDWNRHEVLADSVDALRDLVAQRIATVLPDVARTERPAYYPSFHMSVWRRDLDGGAARDCVFEADLPTWRDAFRDVAPVATLMDRYEVGYRLKFSGHRSLHISIPAEAIPRPYRGRGTRELWKRLAAWSGSQAHALSELTRLPYSLNEDTGLVCLPVERSEVSAFRPWHANVHLVDVRTEAWHEHQSGDQAERMAHVLAEIDDAGADRPCRPFAVPEREHVLRGCWGRLSALAAQDDAPAARNLADPTPLDEPWLLHALSVQDADERWLRCEAYLMRGRALSGAGFRALLNEGEEYVRATAVDVLLRFQGAILPHLVAAICDTKTEPALRARAAYLLTQSDALQADVLAGIAVRGTASPEAAILVGCMVGATLGDWPRAFAILAPLARAPDLPERARAQLAALEIMRNMGGWNRKESAILSQRLAEMGPQITDLLLVAASTPYPRLRRDVVGALAEMADPRTTDLLIRALDDTYTKVRRKAVQGLVAIGEPAVEALVEATAHDQGSIRRYAVMCLGMIGAPAGRSAIIAALDDGEPIVRRQAVRALHRIAGPEDLVRLKQFLREAGWENGLQATEAFVELGSPGEEALRQMAFEERNLVAACWVARQGDDGGREILVERLSEGGEVEEVAAELLRELRDDRCVPTFARTLPTVSDWRGAYIAHELARIGGARAIAVVVEALSSANRHTRRGAVRGLAEARDPSTIEPLLECLEDEDAKVRALAADALVAIGSAAAQPVRQALARTQLHGTRARAYLQRTLRRLDDAARARAEAT